MVSRIWLLLVGARAFASSKLILHEEIASAPGGWTILGDAGHDELCELHIALPEQNRESFQNKVIDVSTPGHELYGHHMSSLKIEEWLRPKEESAPSVVDWIKSHGITAYEHYRYDMISFRTTVEKANNMLDANFAWFEDAEGMKSLRTLSYSIPEYMKIHLDFIHPTIKFPSMRAQRSVIHSTTGFAEGSLDAPPQLSQGGVGESAQQPDSNANCSQRYTPACVKKLPCTEAITPQCLLKLYNTHYRPKTTTKLAFASFLDSRALNSDLRMFENKLVEYAKGQNYTIVGLDGAVDNQNSTKTTEPNLDGQYQIGVGYPNPVTEYLMDGDGPLVPGPNAVPGFNRNEPYIRFLQAMLDLPQDQLPPTLSISYGEDEQSWPRPLATRACSLFSQLGARGVSILVASGDYGPGRNCTSNNGTAAFNPDFPASCPFVTSVGATTSIPEIPAEFSSGGFSNYFARPSYQETQVNHYFQLLGKNNSGLYNRTGRGYPDVSAQGDSYFIYDQGFFGAVGGTSASAPTFAAIISLVNSALVSTGKKPLGFLNPWIYNQKTAAAFNDIATGFSAGCRLNYPTPAQWNATAGWDPATGIGTPDLGKILSMVTPGVSNTGGPVPA